MNLPQLPQDKANHFVYGAIIAALLSPIIGPWPAVLTVIAVGFLKEVSDNWQNYRNAGTHGVELWDALATAAGGIIVVLPQLIKL